MNAVSSQAHAAVMKFARVISVLFLASSAFTQTGHTITVYCNHGQSLNGILSKLIVGYQIDLNTGSLSQISAGPFPTGSAPFSMAFDPSGKFVYVAYSGGGLFAYAFDSNSGNLSPLPGSPFPAGNNPQWITTGTLQ